MAERGFGGVRMGVTKEKEREKRALQACFFSLSPSPLSPLGTAELAPLFAAQLPFQLFFDRGVLLKFEEPTAPGQRDGSKAAREVPAEHGSLFFFLDSPSGEKASTTSNRLLRGKGQKASQATLSLRKAPPPRRRRLSCAWFPERRRLIRRAAICSFILAEKKDSSNAGEGGNGRERLRR